jgi:hypothetical protein
MIDNDIDLLLSDDDFDRYIDRVIVPNRVDLSNYIECSSCGWYLYVEGNIDITTCLECGCKCLVKT